MKTKTISLRKFVREMDLKVGDQFILSGYTSNKNIHADMFRLNEELGIDMKISQKEFLMVDPIEKTTALCWLITVTKADNSKRVIKPSGRREG